MTTTNLYDSELEALCCSGLRDSSTPLALRVEDLGTLVAMGCDVGGYLEALRGALRGADSTVAPTVGPLGDSLDAADCTRFVHEVESLRCYRLGCAALTGQPFRDDDPCFQECHDLMNGDSPPFYTGFFIWR